MTTRLPLIQKSPLIERLMMSETKWRITLTQPEPGIFPQSYSMSRAVTHKQLKSRVKAALHVIKQVAAEDADHARNLNGRGFSKADSSKGHSLSKLSVETVIANAVTTGEVLRIARRYAGQASTLSQMTLF